MRTLETVVKEMRELPVAELTRFVQMANAELTRRKNEERERLITEFRKAWGALKDAGIRITYCDQYEDDITYLDDWDDFSFD